MIDPNDVIAKAVGRKVKELACEMEVSLPRMYEILSKDSPYPKVKRLIRKIAHVSPTSVRIIKADLDAMWQDILEPEGETSIADIHRECCEAVQSGLDERPVAEQKAEICEAMAELGRRLNDLERPAYKALVKEFRKKAAVH